MTKITRRNDSAAFKVKLAKAAIKSDRTLAQIAAQFDVHRNWGTIWKAWLGGGAFVVFGGGEMKIVQT